MVPLTAYNVFRAVAPGITQANGHGEGIRNTITFVVLSGLIGYILAYHLRLADSLQSASEEE